MKTARHRTTKRRTLAMHGSTHIRCTPVIELDDSDDVTLDDELARARARRSVLTGGDVDADWERAEASGDEAVGGSAATPDQDVVDEIGHAVGVERSDEEEFYSSGEILRRRDRYRWHLECDAEDEADGYRHHRRGVV
jgi:uncharacterized protein DUF6335